MASRPLSILSDDPCAAAPDHRPEPGPVDLARGGIIGVGFEGCGAVLEVWPTVEDRSWVEVEDRPGMRR